MRAVHSLTAPRSAIGQGVRPCPDCAALAVRVQALERRFEAMTRPRDDAAFVSALASSIGGRVFSSEALIAHAAVDDTLRSVLGNTTPRRLGKRLRRLSGREIAGFVVCRVKREWCVQVREHLQPDAGFRCDGGA